MANGNPSPGGDSYLLKTGGAAAHHLSVVDAVYGPGTERLLARLVPAAGMQALDVGCGTGSNTIRLARRVGPNGRVTAADGSTGQLTQARRNVEAAGCSNVEFVEADACDTRLPRGAFDFVYCRLLLIHLRRPADAVREFRSLLRPGGMLVCEEFDLDSAAVEPPSPAAARGVELMRAAAARMGVDWSLGRRLPQLFADAGFGGVEVSADQPVFLRGEAKRLGELAFRQTWPGVVGYGLASQAEVERVADEWRARCEDETTVQFIPRMVQVWARR